MAELDVLASDLGASGRTLRRAAARGLIRVHRPSPYKVDISGEERRYIRTHWPLLRALSAALRTEHNLRLAVLYGSAARGDDRSLSDVDLIVAVTGPGLPLARLGMKLEEIIGRPVQIVSLGEAQASPALLAEALRDGRVIVDRDGIWARIRREEGQIVRRARKAEADLQAAASEALEQIAAR